MTGSSEWQTLARYASDEIEGDWGFPVGELVPGPYGIEAAKSTHLMLVLPGSGVRDVRVELVLGGEGGDLLLEASKYSATLGLGKDASCRLRLGKWPLVATGKGPAPPQGDRTVAFERAGGRVSAAVDGRTVLAAADPLPGEDIYDVTFMLNKGAVLRGACVAGRTVPAEASASAPARRVEGFALYNCIDFYDDLIRSPWTEKTFRSAMAAFRRHGVQRLYFIYHYGADGGFWDQPGREEDFPGFQANINRTIEEVGDFLPAAVRYAREVDLPVFAVLKPFETALYGTFPEGSEEAARHGKIPRLGGPMWWSPDFVAQHPHLRVERGASSVPPGFEHRTPASIVLTAEEGTEAALDPARIRLWVSPGNGAYRPYEGSMQVRAEAGAARRIALEGLRLPEKFFALAVEGEPTCSFGNIRRRIVEVRDERGATLPVTFANRPRLRGKGWQEAGFSVDIPAGNAVGALDDHVWLDGGQPLGMALGLERHLQGALCYACPLAKEWMLRQVDRCIEAGVAGVDFRIVNHNRTFDWDAFGFNAPLVEAYRRRWGADILREDFDRERWRRLRGDFYAEFLRAAVARLRASGKASHVHVSPRMGDPAWHTEMEVHYDWAGWIREGLADEITLKMGTMRRHAAPPVVAAARKAGLPLNFCPYLNGLPKHPDGRNILEWMLREAREGRPDGWIMYENAAFMAGEDGGEVRLTQPWILETLAGAAGG